MSGEAVAAAAAAAAATGPKCLAAACPGSKDIPFAVHEEALVRRLGPGADLDVVLCSLTHGVEALVAGKVPCAVKGAVGRSRLYALAAPNREVLSRATRVLMSKCGQARASSAMTRFIEIRLGNFCLFRMVFFTKFRDRTANSDFSSNWTQHVSRTFKACSLGDADTARDNFMELVKKTGAVVRLHLHHSAFLKWIAFDPTAVEFSWPNKSLCETPGPRPSSSSTTSSVSATSSESTLPLYDEVLPTHDAKRLRTTSFGGKNGDGGNQSKFERTDEPQASTDTAGMQGALEGLLSLRQSKKKPSLEASKRILIQVVEDEMGQARLSHVNCADPQQILHAALHNTIGAQRAQQFPQLQLTNNSNHEPSEYIVALHMADDALSIFKNGLSDRHPAVATSLNK
ncbi:Hypothetical Protein FCC1311_072342 [Hondaea fermentalgiana]|uniref:Uncharacterized protein n=1 Tax=Hondaea fermentalgiana TaxID=2315210 RepID=A0A2R5GQW1_9STRA|nr:Hypothetical Protein FCC1311_072342 [Hondaea fermentalgiana]|eukprot:GBG31013.1 Hypothetical Protein FCC1311_072342 [Hondaea fermentalgiana]